MAGRGGRIAGLDRRTVLPVACVFTLIFVFIVVLPAVNAAVPYDNETKAGDVVELENGITFVPAVGWNLRVGLLVGEDTRTETEFGAARLERGGVAFVASTAPFDGDANALLDDLNDHNEANSAEQGFSVTVPRTEITTDDGHPGVVEGFTGTGGSGVIATYVFGGIGVSITAVGSEADVQNQFDAVREMITSFAFDPAAASE